MHPVLDILKARFPDEVLSVHQDRDRGDLSARVRAAHMLDIARFLHDDPRLAFDHITDVCSADYPDDPERFEVIYHVLSLPHGVRLRVKARVSGDNPAIPSVVPVWKGADFMERETYDLMGIRFSGHPDLRRILMPETYDEGYPLRKDFPAEGRGWRSSFPFLPKMDEPVGEVPQVEVPADQKKVFLADSGISPSYRTEELLLNMGPSIRARTGCCGSSSSWTASASSRPRPTWATCTAAWRSWPRGWPTCRSSPTRTGSTTSAR